MSELQTPTVFFHRPAGKTCDKSANNKYLVFVSSIGYLYLDSSISGARLATAMNINELYLQALRGDRSAAAELFGLLTVMFQAFLRRRNVGTEDSEDIVQNALAKIAGSYGRESKKDNFAAWCQTVLKNQFVDFCRAQSTRRNRQTDLTMQEQKLTSPETNPGLKARILSCLNKLHKANSLHARLINLHYQGYTTSEVCTRLKITPNNRRVAMCRARAMLRACLKESEGQNE